MRSFPHALDAVEYLFALVISTIAGIISVRWSERNLSNLYNYALLWFHYRLVVIAQIGNRAFIAPWSLKDADALAVPQQTLVEVVNGAGILREKHLQKSMSGIG